MSRKDNSAVEENRARQGRQAQPRKDEGEVKKPKGNLMLIDTIMKTLIIMLRIA
jgi:hypothetical protein